MIMEFDPVEEDYRSQKLKRELEAAKAKGLVAVPGDDQSRAIAAGKQLETKAKQRRAVAMPEEAEEAAQLLCMKSKWVDVGPDLATTWLEHNICNRPLRASVVNAYARQMIRGEWLPIPQGIAFDTSGALLNGQHRLSAIVQSGVTVRLMVTTGVPSHIAGKTVRPMDLMDTGAPRSVSDQLAVQHGIRQGTVLTAIVRAMLSFALPSRTTKLSVGEVLFVRSLFEDHISFVMEQRPKAHGLRQTGVLAAFVLAFQAGIADLATWRLLMGADEQVALRPGTALERLQSFLTHPDAILLCRTNDRALVPMILHALWCHHQDIAVDDLAPTGTGVQETRRCLASEIAQISQHFSDGKGRQP